MSTPTSTIPATTTAAAGSAPSSAPASSMPIAAFGGIRRVPQPVNDPNRSYAPGSPERAELKARLKAMAAERSKSRSSSADARSAPARTAKSVMPHDHQHVLAE